MKKRDDFDQDRREGGRAENRGRSEARRSGVDRTERPGKPAYEDRRERPAGFRGKNDNDRPDYRGGIERRKPGSDSAGDRSFSRRDSRRDEDNDRERRGGFKSGNDDNRSDYGRTTERRRPGSDFSGDRSFSRRDSRRDEDNDRERRGGFKSGNDDNRSDYGRATERRNPGNGPSDDRPFSRRDSRRDEGGDRGESRTGQRFRKDENPSGETRYTGGRGRENRSFRDEPAGRQAGFRPERERDSDRNKSGEREYARPARRDFNPGDRKDDPALGSSLVRLNRFIANAGICSRREADELIESGQITVNGNVITEMGFKVKSSDIVKYGKRVLNAEKLVYILLNKPKDYITTTDDPEDRKTVLQLIEGACEERVYPVGRLDRNTTGLLLITNDGELADKLTHPSYNTKKVYQAELDKPITTEDFEALKEGVELEDGFIKPDDVGIVTPDAYVVGIEIHSGRNRIVRRLFEQFGYEVKKLDRTVFAGLNKKDLPRGKWRFLTNKEVVTLKYLA